MKNKKAFTLAEVLITLGIIGIVASLTIPGLIASYEKQVTVTQFKKIYSNLLQAFQMAEVDNGPSETWIIGTSAMTGHERAKIYAEQYLYPYFPAVKKCEWNVSGCWQRPVSLNNVQSNLSINMGNGPITSIMKDGSSLYFYPAPGFDGSIAYLYTCTDIDGPFKGKHKLGHDVFCWYTVLKQTSSFIFPRKGFYFPGYNQDLSSTDCNKTSTGSSAGESCGNRILREGWQISGDYPW